MEIMERFMRHFMVETSASSSTSICQQISTHWANQTCPLLCGSYEYLGLHRNQGAGVVYADPTHWCEGESLATIILYLITADIMRGYLHKSLSATLEFIVESDKASLAGPPVSPESVRFYITQDTQKHQLLPELLTGRFRITGKILTECSLMDPIRGELVVEASAVPIRSIDVQLLRIESILAGERIIADTSVIQTTQIADGDVCKSLTLPIYVILPRLLVCPTVRAGPFLIEFQISIVISFQSTLSRLYPKSDLRTPRPWVSAYLLSQTIISVM
ncbi:vacuolar protein sorting-associated protein 26C isoform X4 [Phoenix dactylifera]|uniref:Vacuolar protein sorting-associated protein 26C isoform X4 n=1 Tax=Phoenix dactylifera TaxID=42345 RepID=A0A8B7BNP1_PHODC|nr:vacuolar protein sorting-associated protein 26C isoform X4 [Phoenix dactylifera]XP_017697007.2 vacuolar protein sorting-associated protein 26C isoform X4 [Phoenix dactylifera]XP_038986045.1 vacuolar protein sorting-associated protein 26C isoform X4 [Phoenix dactylifera]